MTSPINDKKSIITLILVSLAILLVFWKYRDYVLNPWTRDGQVRAQVIQITPRISGPIINLPIEDNQYVKKGDLLFEIDPRTYKASLDQAIGELGQTRDNLSALGKQVEAASAEVEMALAKITESESELRKSEAHLVDATSTYNRMKRLVRKGHVSKQHFDQATETYDQALASKDESIAALLSARASHRQAIAQLAHAKANLGAPGEENAQLRSSIANLKNAELNLEFTRVRAPVDGYITNLNLRLGSQCVANQPVLALIDTDSFWIHGYFRENDIAGIQSGNQAVITLMSYPEHPLEGYVDSVGWGVAQSDGSTGFDLLPTVSPTFEWIRLAQRIPVRVHLKELPAGVRLRVGSTASVLVRTGTTSDQPQTPAVAVPKALQ